MINCPETIPSYSTLIYRNRPSYMFNRYFVSQGPRVLRTFCAPRPVDGERAGIRTTLREYTKAEVSADILEVAYSTINIPSSFSGYLASWLSGLGKRPAYSVVLANSFSGTSFTYNLKGVCNRRRRFITASEAVFRSV